MAVYWHIVAQPLNGGPPILYLTKNIRFKHGGPFTDEFAARKTWKRRDHALAMAEWQQSQNPNRVYGMMSFQVVPEEHPEEPQP